MKTEIHPTYYAKAKMTCACGAKHEIGSTIESYSLDVCSQCHPFYTGKQKLVDTAGRVDKFKQRMEAAQKMQSEQDARSASKKKKETVEEKMTRKAATKEAAKEAEKAEIEVKKKEAAKKAAKKTVVKKVKVEKVEKKGSDSAEASSDSDKSEESEE